MADLVRRGERVVPAPAASIVILVLDRVDRLAGCLRALAAMPGEPSHEVIVVGNGTSEEVLAALPEPENLVVVPSPLNLGFAGGCNWGARFARGRHLVFLNDDTEVEPGWLAALVDVAESDPRIGAVGSRLLDPDGTLQEAGSVLWSDAGTHQVGRGLPPGSAAHDRVRDVDYCSGCGLLVRREAWDLAGGFDEAYYPAYFEDVDLCLTLRSHGFRTVYAPRARLVHHRGSSTSPELRTRLGLRSGHRFIAKWGDALRDFDPPPRGRDLDAAVAAAVLRAEQRPLPPLAALRGPLRPVPAPTEVDLLRAQVRALQGAQALLEDELRPLRREHAQVERLRRAARRVPGGRRGTAWLSRRLGPGS
jgi:GT2 family glycosyltransferase